MLSRSCIGDVSHVFHLLYGALRELPICMEAQFRCTLSMHIEMRTLSYRAFKNKHNDKTDKLNETSLYLSAVED